MTERRGAEVVLAEVTKRYVGGDGQALVAADAVTLRIDPGSTVALTGPSGSGKSTLLHLVGAMDEPTSGTITVDDIGLSGLDRRRLAAYRRSVGFVFQRFHLLPALTVEDNVLAPLIPLGRAARQPERVTELLAAVGLAGRERALPSQLSGGQQQRVALARALVSQPRLLLADEPTGNLDSTTGAEVLDLLFALQAQTGMTILLATHDVRAATRCDRLIRLRDGHVLDDTTLHDGSAAILLDQIGRLRSD